MLIEFQFGNFKSFRELSTISMVASSDESLKNDNVIDPKLFDLKVLKSAVVFGGNANGKTNALDAFAFFRWMILNSSKESQVGEIIDATPFLFNEDSEYKPSHFQIILIHNGKRFRYGFTTDREQIHSEWFYCREKIKEVELFIRDKNDYETHKTLFNTVKVLESKAKTKVVSKNALLVSVAARFEEKSAVEFLNAVRNMRLISDQGEQNQNAFTIGLLETQKDRVLKFLQLGDIHIDDLQLQPDLNFKLTKELKGKLPKNAKGVQAFDLVAKHKKYSENGLLKKDLVSLNMDDESSGTRKFFALAGPVLDTLDRGGVLFADEMEAKLHPFLVRIIARLFNSKDYNKKNAQLLFTTHDTNLLSGDLFRRDQIWFVERNRMGESSLYSLARYMTKDNQKVRKDAHYEKQYLEGRYGGLPSLGDLHELFIIDHHIRISLNSLNYENER